jgi:hypothetical protein
MKTILYLLCVAAPVGSLLAQGVISFGNSVGNVSKAPVYGPDPSDPFSPKYGNTATGLPVGTQTYGGTPLAGATFTAAIYTLVGDNVVEIGRSDFRSGSGFWQTRNVTDPFHGGGSTITAIVRVWDSKNGTITSWDQALAAGNTPLGQSVPFSVSGLGGTDEYGNSTTPPPTVEFRSFNIYQRGGAFIVTQPPDLTVAPGGATQLHVGVASDVGAPSFRWQRNGVDIPGATAAALTLDNVTFSDAGNYAALATFSSMTLTSRVAKVTVQPSISGINRVYVPELGISRIRLSYDSVPNLPVRIEARTSLQGSWINLGQFVSPDVSGSFTDTAPTGQMRIYRLSINP